MEKRGLRIEKPAAAESWQVNNAAAKRSAFSGFEPLFLVFLILIYLFSAWTLFLIFFSKP